MESMYDATFNYKGRLLETIAKASGSCVFKSWVCLLHTGSPGFRASTTFVMNGFPTLSVTGLPYGNKKEAEQSASFLSLKVIDDIKKAQQKAQEIPPPYVEPSSAPDLMDDWEMKTTSSMSSEEDEDLTKIGNDFMYDVVCSKYLKEYLAFKRKFALSENDTVKPTWLHITSYSRDYPIVVNQKVASWFKGLILSFLRSSELTTLAISKLVFGPDGTTGQINPILYRISAICRSNTIGKPSWKIRDFEYN